jgi:hypothetical protein
MTTGRINQVATLSRLLFAHELKLVQPGSEQNRNRSTCKQVGVFG